MVAVRTSQGAVGSLKRITGHVVCKGLLVLPGAQRMTIAADLPARRFGYDLVESSLVGIAMARCAGMRLKLVASRMVRE